MYNRKKNKKIIIFIDFENKTYDFNLKILIKYIILIMNYILKYKYI